MTNQHSISNTKLFLILLPALLSIALSMAHFYRESSNILFVLSALLIPLILFRHIVALKLAQLALIFITAEWFYTAYQFISIRLEMGGDWVRLAMIMGAVIIFNITAMLLLSKRSLTGHYSV